MPDITDAVELAAAPQAKIGMILLKLFLGLVGVLAVFGLGMVFGGQLASSHWKSRVIQQAENSSIVIAKKEGERDQCRAQIDKVNKALSEQKDELAKRNRQDQEARAQARREAAERDKKDREQAALVMAALEQLRDDITEGKFDACTGTVADTDYMRLLNEILAASAGSDNAGRDGGLSAAEGDH